MNTPRVSDTWERGDPYEQYIGRWSRLVAPLFLRWLDPAAGKRWLDVGCGTGALTSAIVDHCAPGSVTGVEPAAGFRNLAARTLAGRAVFLAGHAGSIPLDDGACDVVVSGLVLNFVPDLPAALSEMRRVTAPSGTIAAYVWDYAGGMELIKAFWDAASSIDPAAAQLHEGTRFPLCQPAALERAFEDAGIAAVQTTALDLVARFTGFDDYWRPFLGGQGPAPAYAMSLPEPRRALLRDRLQSALPGAGGGAFSLEARAWAVRGTARGEA